jgi:hypothetical protein
VLASAPGMCAAQTTAAGRSCPVGPPSCEHIRAAAPVTVSALCDGMRRQGKARHSRRHSVHSRHSRIDDRVEAGVLAVSTSPCHRALFCAQFQLLPHTDAPAGCHRNRPGDTRGLDLHNHPLRSSLGFAEISRRFEAESSY